ncbi:MAG: HEAT repeat domain-containing protein, partial [Planctomycetota bacterium]
DGPPQRKNIDTLRLKMTAQLEDAARKYHRHQCQEVLEALLLIARPSNATLRQLIARPDEAACQPILDLLAKSGRGGVIRLLLGFLEEPQAPLAVLRILGARTDARFVEHLLRTLATRPQRNANENLARIDTVAWAEPAHPLLAELSEGAQAGAVEMLLVTSVERSRVRDVLKHLLEQGNVGGRRAAAKAIVQFHGPEVDALLVRMLGDPDAEVRAAVIPHLRPRRIELALGRLIRMADSNEPAVRQALREALPEFSLQRFLGSFMHFDEEMQMMAGSLIRRIDDQVAEKLTAEMTGLSPVRRRRAVLAAAVMGMTHELEQVIIQLLSDDDHMVRVAAAQALAECKSVPSWEALRDALLDRSVVVKEAAEKSLEQISASLTSDAADELDDLPGTPAERTEYTPC